MACDEAPANGHKYGIDGLPGMIPGNKKVVARVDDGLLPTGGFATCGEMPFAAGR